jgi:hypothetical protein
MCDLNINTKVQLINPVNGTLTINSDSTKYEFYEIESCDIELKQNAGSTFSIELSIADNKDLLNKFPENSTQVKIYKGIRGSEQHYVTGILKNKSVIYDNGLYTYTLEGVDYTAVTTTILINEAYNNKSISFIVSDLYNKYLKSQYELELIDVSNILISVKFKEKYLFDALEKLADMLFWNFEITKDLKFKFYDPKTVSSVGTITSNDYIGVIKAESDTSRLITRLRVQGPNKVSVPKTQKWIADGDTTVFKIPMKNVLTPPNGQLDFYINNVLTQYNLKYSSNYTEDVHYLFNENDSCFEAETPPSSGANIRSVYQYKYPLIFYIEDKPAIAKYGTITKKIRVDSLSDISAQMEARTYLNKYCRPIIRVELNVVNGVYNAGDIVTLNLPEVQITGDYKITSVSYNGVYENDIALRLESGY